MYLQIACKIEWKALDETISFGIDGQELLLEVQVGNLEMPCLLDRNLRGVH